VASLPCHLAYSIEKFPTPSSAPSSLFQGIFMSHYSVTLPVPDYIYDRARQIAEGTSQSIEAVLLKPLQEAFTRPLPDLVPDEQRELEALTHLSNDALWTIAREQTPEGRQARL
jgi:hypothetical protein